MAPPVSRFHSNIPRRVPAGRSKIFPSSTDLPDAQGVLGLLAKKEISTGVGKRPQAQSVQSSASLSIARHKPFPGTKATVEKPTLATDIAAEPLPPIEASLKSKETAQSTEVTIAAPEDSRDEFEEEDSICQPFAWKFFEDSFDDNTVDEDDLTPEQLEVKRKFDEGVAFLVANPQFLPRFEETPETPHVPRPAQAPVQVLPFNFTPRDKPVFTRPPRQSTRVDSPWPASSSGQK